MKFITIIALMSFSSFSFATDVWDITNHSSEDLKTEIEISEAINAYPQILTKWQGQASDIKYIHLTIINFEWTGETVCPENDPRLKHEAVNYIACPDEQISMKCAFELDPVLTPFGDPCKE